jgi:hypothetical protein
MSPAWPAIARTGINCCGYRHCLVGDQDDIYDPATTNGRLILGLKGLISELELHTIRARLTAGILSKAQRGELALTLPTGLVRDPLGQVNKHADQEIQGRIGLVFDTFLRVRSVTKVVRTFNDQNLSIPRRNRLKDIVWRKPTVAAVGCLLQNPAYAGAFVYGRTRSVPKHGSGRRSLQRRLPMDQWKICIRDKYPAYIAWATFETIQAMIRDNHSEYDRNKTRGVPRAGKALLHGIVYCGECGHKMVVQYKGGTRYICNYLRQQHQCPVCQYLPADAIDDQSCHSSSQLWRRRSWTSMPRHRPAWPKKRNTSGGPGNSRSSVCAIRLNWLSASSTNQTQTIDS